MSFSTVHDKAKCVEEPVQLAIFQYNQHQKSTSTFVTFGGRCNACTYLKRRGHVYDIEKACYNLVVYVKAKCRPTIRKTPVFYKCFVKVELIAGTSHVVGGNCD